MRGHLDVIVVGYHSRGHEMDWIARVVSSWEFRKLFVEMVCQGGVSWLVGAAVDWAVLFVRGVLVCPVGLSSA